VYFVPINVIICFTRWRSSPSKLVTHIICQQQQVTSLIRHLTEKHCTAKVSKDTGQHTLHSHKAACECCNGQEQNMTPVPHNLHRCRPLSRSWPIIVSWLKKIIGG